MSETKKTRLFGLKNCASCRKAQRWFDAGGHPCSFEDIRAADNTHYVVKRIAASDNWLAFVNRRSTTWRALADAQKRDLNRDAALALLRTNPTLIKRPVVVIGDDTLAGFDPDAILARLD